MGELRAVGSVHLKAKAVKKQLGVNRFVVPEMTDDLPPVPGLAFEKHEVMDSVIDLMVVKAAEPGEPTQCACPPCRVW
jgi:hypothetical protein